MGSAFEAITALANRQAHILEPFRQYLGEYFEFVAIHYKRRFIRPQMGLTLEVNGGKNTLSLRPGWKQPRRYPTDEDPGVPGKFQPQEITLALVKELKLILAPGGVVKVAGKVWMDEDANERNLKTICEAADSLLRSPMATFGEQQRCVCCNRCMFDPTNRTRGCGPKCVRWLCFFEKANRITRKYRAEYRI